MEITKKQLQTIKNICRRISGSTGVDSESLYSECTSKIPKIIKNFRPELGKPFDAYLAISVRGYALNYCRDKSFLSTVNRSDLQLYMQSKKFDNLEQASQQLLIPIHILEDIHLKIKNSRKYNSISIYDEWKLGDITPSSNTSVARLSLLELLTEREEDMLIDYFVTSLDNKQMISKYGLEYLVEIKRAKKVLEENKEELMDSLL